MTEKLTLPAGDYDTLANDDRFAPLFDVVWRADTIMADKFVIPLAMELGLRPYHVLPHVAFAQISMMAWTLASAAKVSEEQFDFDPVAFGKRCEEIAREQINRFRTACEEIAGSA
jgi:hypothetical protein